LRRAQPVAVQRGDRFILRQASPSRTLAGGVVVNPYPGRRWRRFRPEVVDMLDALRSGEPPRLLEQALRSAEPASLATLATSSGLDSHAATGAFQQLAAAGRLVVLDKEWPPDAATAPDARQRIGAVQTAMSAQGWQDLQARLAAVIASYHRQYPLRQGMPREELKSRLQGRRRKSWTLRVYNDIVAAAAAAGRLVEEGSLVRLPSHTVQLSSAQQAAVDQLLALFAANPTTPPNVAECQAVTGEDLFAWLVDSGQLVRVSEDVVLDAAAYEAMIQRIMDHLRSETRITVAQVRDICNTSRKYALALMEHLDARRITRRVGDERVLRRGADE
jgi:selenocysteine-specific elongation factor